MAEVAPQVDTASQGFIDYATNNFGVGEKSPYRYRGDHVDNLPSLGSDSNITEFANLYKGNHPVPAIRK